MDVSSNRLFAWMMLISLIYRFSHSQSLLLHRNAQVHRIHDLMDINTLRLAKVGIDPPYKTMVWNLVSFNRLLGRHLSYSVLYLTQTLFSQSQNVDRDTMGTVRILDSCECVCCSLDSPLCLRLIL